MGAGRPRRPRGGRWRARHASARSFPPRRVPRRSPRACATTWKGCATLGFTVRDDARVAPRHRSRLGRGVARSLSSSAGGRSLLIAPPWDAPRVAGRFTIVIEPGRAFGTGQHGSTAGCLEMLERIVARQRAAPRPRPGNGFGHSRHRGGAPRHRPRSGHRRRSRRGGQCPGQRRAQRSEHGRDVHSRATRPPWRRSPRPLVLANILAATHARLAHVVPRPSRSRGLPRAGRRPRQPRLTTRPRSSSGPDSRGAPP